MDSLVYSSHCGDLGLVSESIFQGFISLFSWTCFSKARVITQKPKINRHYLESDFSM